MQAIGFSVVSEIVDERVNQCFEFWLQSLHSLGIESLHQELAYARVSRWIDVDDIREESAAFPLEDLFHLVEMAIGHLLVVPEFLRKRDRKSTTSELQSLMRISYAVFCLNIKKTIHN